MSRREQDLEKEAEQTAQRVMSGGELGIQRMSKTDVHVQRTTESAGPEQYGEANKTAIGMVNSTVEDLTQRVEQIEAQLSSISIIEDLAQGTAEHADSEGDEGGGMKQWTADVASGLFSGEGGKETAKQAGIRGLAALGGAGAALATGGAALPVLAAGLVSGGVLSAGMAGKSQADQGDELDLSDVEFPEKLVDALAQAVAGRLDEATSQTRFD